MSEGQDTRPVFMGTFLKSQKNQDQINSNNIIKVKTLEQKLEKIKKLVSFVKIITICSAVIAGISLILGFISYILK